MQNSSPLQNTKLLSSSNPHQLTHYLKCILTFHLTFYLAFRVALFNKYSGILSDIYSGITVLSLGSHRLGKDWWAHFKEKENYASQGWKNSFTHFGPMGQIPKK